MPVDQRHYAKPLLPTGRQILGKMGLSVRVFKNISVTTDNDDFDFEAYVIDKNWEHKIKNLEKGKLYKGDCVDRNINYAYSSHNRFREGLINLIDRKDLLIEDGTINWANLPENIPFYDFIDFADNEGCLDWEVSKKIYASFKEYETKAQTFFSGYTLDKYNEWLNVFEKAQDNGVVVFR